MRTVVGARQHVAADDVDLIGKLGGDGHPGERLVDLAPARSPQTGDRRGESAGQHYHFVADSEPPARDGPRVGTVVVEPSKSCGRTTYWTGSRVVDCDRWRCTPSRWLSRARPVYHGMASERVTTLSPASAEIGMNVRSVTVSFVANSVKSRGSPRTALDSNRRGPSCSRRSSGGECPATTRGTRGAVSARALPCARVDEDDRQVRRSTPRRPCCACTARGRACRR